MQKIVDWFDDNYVVEEDDVKCGALVFLSENPHQEKAPWNEYQ